MARRTIVLDELHLTVSAPRGLADAVYSAAHRTLKKPAFLASLRQAIRQVFRRHPSLSRVRFTITR